MGAVTTSIEADKSFETILTSTLKRVDDYLRFAEAKNGALLTFASAWALANFTLIASGRAGTFVGERAAFVSLALLLCAALCAVASFFPRTNLPGFLGGKRAGPHDANLSYFGDIASLTPGSFDAKVRERYYPDKGSGPTKDYLTDLVIQIAVVSQITTYKLQFFKFGTAFLGSAIAVLLIPVLLHMTSTP